MPLSQTGIQNFYEKIREQDLSRKFQFTILRFGNDYYNRDIVGNNNIVLMTTASLPEAENNVKQVPYMGLNFNVPGTMSYPGSDSWSVNFRMPGNFALRNVFERWLFNIFNDDTSTGDYAVPCPSSSIEVGLLNSAGAIVKAYSIIGVFCRRVGAVEYDKTDGGEVATFNADMAYQYWRPVPTDSIIGSGEYSRPDRIGPIYDAYESLNSATTTRCA